MEGSRRGVCPMQAVTKIPENAMIADLRSIDAPGLIIMGFEVKTDLRPLEPGAPPNLSEQEPMLYCPVCSKRLSERKCKLFCEQCGYYMSCADYY